MPEDPAATVDVTEYVVHEQKPLNELVRNILQDEDSEVDPDSEEAKRLLSELEGVMLPVEVYRGKVRNGEAALRAAAKVVGLDEGALNLVATPTRFWQVKKVEVKTETTVNIG